MVSPYLLRPIRTFQQAAREREEGRHFEEIASRALEEGRAAGEAPPQMLKRAVAAIIRRDPRMTYRAALAIVQRADGSD